ncbi:hypothetical protein Cassandra_0135 [Pseudomonas phage Cassandra]|nr:hypothetical protein Cassandra_0135 [Pseudomonas phage Cassandra]WPK39332.1 hypothetical protein Deiofobo_0135 [Pseudomonas phage Deifobo]WPK40365.1 hypothetical protein Paride_0135 [Pseudomonas phage Paride]BDR25710.1 hypothetical protein RVBP16_1500 [Pseudomonas phage sp. 30-2]
MRTLTSSLFVIIMTLVNILSVIYMYVTNVPLIYMLVAVPNQCVISLISCVYRKIIAEFFYIKRFSFYKLEVVLDKQRGSSTKYILKLNVLGETYYYDFHDNSFCCLPIYANFYTNSESLALNTFQRYEDQAELYKKSSAITTVIKSSKGTK